MDIQSLNFPYLKIADLKKFKPLLCHINFVTQLLENKKPAPEIWTNIHEHVLELHNVEKILFTILKRVSLLLEFGAV